MPSTAYRVILVHVVAECCWDRSGHACIVIGAKLAEGIAVRNIGGFTRPVVRKRVADVLLVDEPTIERAVDA